MGEASPVQNKDSIDPLIGRVINDRFEIISLIARGGMGRVYRAKQQPLGRLVALKVLDPRQNQAEDSDFQQRFFLEAATAAKLSHPNTVTVFDYGKTTDDIFFIVMELVEGRTLASILKDYAPIDGIRAVHIAAQIARSLREAHSLGVIHRDLKPANVILTKHADEEDFAKVLDFGLVKNVGDDDEMTQAGTFMGSPKYMAPEQIQGGHCDARTDVYALGCVLYYMLVGRVPFDRENQVQILMAHCRDAVPPMLRDDGETIPAGLVQVTLRCLAKEADQRFADMNEVIAALKHATQAGGGRLMTSGSHTIEADFSGMRAVPPGSPAAGTPILLTPAGGIPTMWSSESSIPSITLDVPDFTPPKRRAGAFAGIAAAVILVGGGAGYLASKQGAVRAEATDTTAITNAQTANPAVAAATPPPSVAPVAPAAPEAPVAHVQVSLRSDPPGAEVFVGDRSYGETPANVEWLGEQAAAGREVTIRFVRPGYRPLTVTRTLTGESLEVNAELVANAPSPRVSAPTRGADRPVGRVNGYLDSPY